MISGGIDSVPGMHPSEADDRFPIADLRAVALAHRRQRLFGPIDFGRSDPEMNAAIEAYLDRHPEIKRNDHAQRLAAGERVTELLCEAVDLWERLRMPVGRLEVIEEIAQALAIRGAKEEPFVLFGAVDATDFLIGIAKAATFGLTIAAIGCERGLGTGAGATSVGLSATSAVVSSIVLIVVIDGIFAVLIS